MKIILITGNSTRHIAFANRLRISKKINLIKVFYELGNPLETNVNNQTKNQLLLSHLSERQQAEDDVFNWFIEFASKNKLDESYVERGFMFILRYLFFDLYTATIGHLYIIMLLLQTRSSSNLNLTGLGFALLSLSLHLIAVGRHVLRLFVIMISFHLIDL